LNIWIIADKVSDKSKNKINKLAEKYCQNEVNWIENLNIPYKLKLDRGSMSAFSRLFLGSRIPSEVKKIMTRLKFRINEEKKAQKKKTALLTQFQTEKQAESSNRSLIVKTATP